MIEKVAEIPSSQLSVEPDSSESRQFVVIGGGPAGLTAAYELSKRGHLPVVMEMSHTVGGIARTESYKGYHFDMGGHRFFTKSNVAALTEAAGEDERYQHGNVFD